MRNAAFAQEAGPLDFDLKLIPERKILRQGDQVLVDSTLTTRKAGVSGWSYGVEHDESLLNLVSVTIEGGDVLPLLRNGFEATEIIPGTEGNVGWIQAVILSLQEKVELPITPRFVMAKARYTVRAGICGARNEIPTSIVYSDKLAVRGGPPIEITVTLEGKSITPAVKEPAELVLECPAAGAPDLKLLAQSEVARKLRADRTDVLGIKVMLQNNTQGAPGPVEVQGWSYGLQLDPALLEVVDLTSGVDAAALNGGAGPDFRAYNFRPLDQSSDGRVQGVSVGVVISLDPPDQMLGIPAAQSRHLETLKAKSAIVIAEGQPDRSTDLVFVSEVLGLDRPIENIITIDGRSVSPKSDTPSMTVVLTALPPTRLFARGHANPDGRIDIADGIWIIRVLFYREGQLTCQDAADANDDGRLDVADAVFTFNYMLRAGPRPLAPFPGCGEDTSPDNLTCEQATRICI